MNCMFWMIRLGHTITFLWTGEDLTSHIMGIAGKPHVMQLGTVTWMGSLN